MPSSYLHWCNSWNQRDDDKQTLQECFAALKNAEFRFVDNEDTQALTASKRKTGVTGISSREQRKKNIPLLVGELPNPDKKAILNVTVAVKLAVLSQNVQR